MYRPKYRSFRAACLLATGALLAAAPAKAASPPDLDRSSVCGFLPYRDAGPDRFAGPRRQADKVAKVGPQTTYSLAWDLARPVLLAAELAEDLLAGQSVDAVRDVHGGALSLGEYMLHAAQNFAAAPPAPESDDFRVLLAAERPANFHRIYAHAKQGYEELAAMLAPDAAPPDPATLKRIAASWRPTYGMLAKAQADDKRIELIATDLDADAVAEKEAVACLAAAIAAAAGDWADAAAVAKAAAARWPLRPTVNARALAKAARVPFFEYEDAGDALAAKIEALPDGPVDDAAFRDVGKAYVAFVAASKAYYEAQR